uniref:Uncharacterized protein n=1 Tax=Panagrolaimus davidi TaxID=227884 RepID=A0A914QP56_9BILA
MVRIFCLTSIYQITPTTNVVNITPYEEGADESYISFNEEEILLHYTSTKIIENLQNFSSYKLTEISIGWENTLKLKRYLIYIYREDTGLMVFKMVRGAVQFNTIEKGIYEIIVATSKLYPNKFDFDLRIIIRHIKCTKIRKISTKEKEYFENYAKQIEEFCNNERTFREAAFDQIKFVLPNKSKENYLRTQLSDIKTLIYLLCNPKTGSYRRAREQRDLDNPFIKRDNCHELEWAHVKLSNVHLNDKEKEKISYISLEDIQIFDESKKLYPCLKNFNFANLTMLLLNECGRTELSDHFLEILPLTLKNMNFRRNKISYISKSISRFHNLLSLDLSFNERLNDEGFPWAFMPINIEELFLKQASITKIPAEIRRLQNLDEIQDFNCSHLPPTITILDLTKSKLKYFDCQHFSPNLIKLKLNNNFIEAIEWQNLPTTLENLRLNSNYLTFIGDITHLTNLEILSAEDNKIDNLFQHVNFPTLQKFNLQRNFISILPQGFENSNNLKILRLSYNNLNYQQFDIYESLWNRLPVSLDELSLNANLLNNLPCMLNNWKFKKLSVKDCNLKHICFKLFHKCLFNKSQFDIRGNPSIKCLPYFPKDFYPPTSSQKIWNNNCDFSFNLITDNSDFIYARQFPLKKGKLNFAFKECKEDGKYLNECKCCIICGKETDAAIIKQILVMDIYLRLYPSSEGDPDPNVLVEGVGVNIFYKFKFKKLNVKNNAQGNHLFSVTATIITEILSL